MAIPVSYVYDLWLGGTKLTIGKKECITSIETNQTSEGADSMTIRISDPDFKFINDNIFKEDVKVRCKMGIDTTTSRFDFQGYIAQVIPSFPADGIPTLEVYCLDKTYLMHKKKRSATFKKTRSSNVVRKIAKRYGYKVVIEKGYKFTKQDSITQSNQSDAEMLQSLASSETYPFSCKLVGKTIYYVRKGKLTTPKRTLKYKAHPFDIISFNPSINLGTIQIDVKTSKVTKNKKTSKSSSGSSKSTGGNTQKKSGSGGSSSKGTTKKKTYNPKTKKWT